MEVAVDNKAAILALLDKRFKEAEAKIVTSPQFLALKARNAHMLWEHGSMDICKGADTDDNAA